MSNMQAFRTRLIQMSEVDDPLLQSLAQLTEATSTQLEALLSDLGWSSWNVEVA
jgi:hypothetical protein